MSNTDFDANVAKFLGQSDKFLQLALTERGVRHLDDLDDITSLNAFPIDPIKIEDYRSIDEGICDLISKSYQTFGAAHLLCLNPNATSEFSHPIFSIVTQLKNHLHLYHTLTHPLEGHPESVSRFGPNDGTVKIYNLPKDGARGYKEVAESNEAFEVHSDGLGSGGTVKTVILYCDSAPLSGGYTFFYDVVGLSLQLAKIDYAAFRALFLPNAITAVRPRGKGAIKVISPVVYINEDGEPACFFRRDSGEYRMTWANDENLRRAVSFLEHHTRPFSNGSRFIHFSRPGQCAIARNRDFAHGRTPFIDGENEHERRLLSRKWFMRTSRDATYKHVPGMFLMSEYAKLFPQFFGDEILQGEWLYDARTDSNQRIK